MAARPPPEWSRRPEKPIPITQIPITQWRTLAEGTPIAELFSERYAGLFRNPTAKPEAARELYGAHLYPVFTEGRCRLNVTGLPSDAAQAQQAVAAFARCCG